MKNLHGNIWGKKDLLVLCYVSLQKEYETASENQILIFPLFKGLFSKYDAMTYTWC